MLKLGQNIYLKDKRYLHLERCFCSSQRWKLLDHLFSYTLFISFKICSSRGRCLQQAPRSHSLLLFSSFVPFSAVTEFFLCPKIRIWGFVPLRRVNAPTVCGVASPMVKRSEIQANKWQWPLTVSRHYLLILNCVYVCMFMPYVLRYPKRPEIPDPLKLEL